MCLEGGAAVIKVDERIQEGGAAVMKVEEKIQEGGAAVIKVDERIQEGGAAVIKLEERIQCFWSVDPLISELSFKYNGVTEQVSIVQSLDPHTTYFGSTAHQLLNLRSFPR